MILMFYAVLFSIGFLLQLLFAHSERCRLIGVGTFLTTFSMLQINDFIYFNEFEFGKILLVICSACLSIWIFLLTKKDYKITKIIVSIIFILCIIVYAILGVNFLTKV